MAEFRRLLESALGADQSQQIVAKAQRMAAARDPFASLRDIEPPRLVEALANEPPQVVAMVLAELPSARSSEALGLLPETTRPDVIRAMAGGEAASAEVRLRIATAIADRLKQKAAQPGGGVASDAAKTQRLRKVALLLRGQPPEQRQPLIDSLSQQDADAGKLVNELMVTWEDLTHLADRSLQEALRVVDTRKLALAMVGCDDRTIDKIRRNISERARASLDEETSLLSSPSDKEVEEGRASLLEALREINAQGTLKFEDA
jgi:flagellar motor switch protein FliG